MSFLNRLGNVFKAAEKSEGQSSIIVHSSAIGSTGVENYSGYYQEEYLDELQGTDRALVYDKMRRGDPQIKMCLNAVKSPIASATWEVMPFDDKDEDCKKDAALVDFILFRGMHKTKQEFINEALSFLVHGFSLFEMIDKVIHNTEFGVVNGLENLAFRGQKTIERWNLNPKTDMLLSVNQMANGDLFRNVDIPAEFLIAMTLDKEGSNYEGISALRPCYGSWFRKNLMLRLNTIGIEKFAVPTPIGTVPSLKENTPEFERFKEVLESFVSHEKAYMTKPEGWEIELNTNAYDPQKVEVSIDNEDKRMVKSFMANFLELGMNGFGSQSLSFDLSDFFLGSIDHIANIVCQEVNRTVIPRLVQMNRGPRKGYPTLKVSGISDKVGVEFATMIKAYSDGKLIKPDQVLEDYLRKRHGLPEAVKLDLGIETESKPENKPATAFNGPQVTALLEVIGKVASGALPRDSAVNIIVRSFGMDQAEAEKVLGSIQPKPVSSIPQLSERVKKLLNG